MLLITCPPWLAQICKKELAYLDHKSQVYGPATLFVEEKDESDIAKLNIWLRTANKISLIVDSRQTETFDELFDFVYEQPWDKIISADQVVLVEWSTYQSQLASLPAIQKIVKKAITKKLMNWTDAQWIEDKSKGIIYISVMLHQNKAILSLNSSGDSLHRRGYRMSTGDAPIKETIAAGLVISSGWKFHEMFLDPCCGSGTIAIEAAMIAKNIAPGLHRKFAFEDRSRYKPSYLVDAKATAKWVQVHKSHTIIASDIDPEMIEKAKNNAKKAGLTEDAIQWDVKPCQEYMTELAPIVVEWWDNITVTGAMVANPPYGIRMTPWDIDEIHSTLFALAEKHDLSGGIVTAYVDADRCCTHPDRRTTMIIKNGAEDTTFWKKKEK
jgi:putative N6-adenine-specific DNA methylase